jgi:hypothetical protein
VQLQIRLQAIDRSLQKRLGKKEFVSMPMESRVLHFATDEVFEALKEYCAQTGRAIPNDAACSLVLFRGTEMRVTLSSPRKEATTTFSESEVGTALIMFCIRKRIPIARRSVKSLNVGRDTVQLRLDIRT